MTAIRRSYVVQRPSSVVTNIVCAFVAVAAVFVLPPVLVVVIVIAIAIVRWLAVRWHDATMMFLACLPASQPASLPVAARSVCRLVWCL